MWEENRELKQKNHLIAKSKEARPLVQVDYLVIILALPGPIRFVKSVSKDNKKHKLRAFLPWDTQ